jgi:hypothetical protein
MEVAPPRARVSKMAIRHIHLTASSKTANPLQIRSAHRTHPRYMANVTHTRAIQSNRKPKPLPSNIVAAFRHPDRICDIDIGITSSVLNR